MTVLRGLPPIMDERARVLILGSFPSAASLTARQYYAHKQNQFWKILGAILEQPLHEMDYAAKQAAVKDAGIAIWDVYAACERAGSLDSAIRNAVPNDFAKLSNAVRAGRRPQKSALAGRRSAGLAARVFQRPGGRALCCATGSVGLRNADPAFDQSGQCHLEFRAQAGGVAKRPGYLR